MGLLGSFQFGAATNKEFLWRYALSFLLGREDCVISETSGFSTQPSAPWVNEQSRKQRWEGEEGGEDKTYRCENLLVARPWTTPAPFWSSLSFHTLPRSQPQLPVLRSGPWEAPADRVLYALAPLCSTSHQPLPYQASWVTSPFCPLPVLSLP